MDDGQVEGEIALLLANRWKNVDAPVSQRDLAIANAASPNQIAFFREADFSVADFGYVDAVFQTRCCNFGGVVCGHFAG